ncbi:MAG TPA: hypothetical protein VF508_02870, partial [Pyrinomonadaceae bacterium]
FTYTGSRAGTDTAVAKFVNNEGITQSSNTVTAEWRGAANAPTLLSVSPADGTYGGTTALSARLTAEGAPLAGRNVTFTLNGAAVGVAITDAAGVAAVANVGLAGIDAGAYPNAVVANFAGDTGHSPSSGAAALTVRRAASRVVADGGVLANNAPAMLTATLFDSNSQPLAGRAVTLTLGTGPSAQTCVATTDAAGRAVCRIERVSQPLGPGTVSAGFAGDTNYLPSAGNAATLVYEFPAAGSFVVGDLSATAGQRVTFWGAQWWKANALSGGPAPSSFKGFADVFVPAACGGTWTAGPGNSSGPPRRLPSYMAVPVSGSVTKSGATLSGRASRVVIVKTDPGYDADPGHAGTGTVVAVLCP